MQDDTPAAQPARPYGRSLSDFTTVTPERPQGLWPAEQKLLEHVRKGEPCEIGKERPAECTEENRIDTAFLRFLLLGGDETAPVHEKGVEVQGAYIFGDVNLAKCRNVSPIFLFHCNISGKLIGNGAKFANLDLTGSFVRGINCEGASFQGRVSLCENFETSDEVWLLDTKIDGPLDCRKGFFNNGDGFALLCDRIKVTGGVFLANGFEAVGVVNFDGAEIGGPFVCSGGLFNHRTISPLDNIEDPLRASFALVLQGAKIQGTLWLGSSGKTYPESPNIQGSVNLQNGYTQELVDSIEAWPKGPVGLNKQNIPYAILLDGFTYERLTRGAPIDAKTRLQWLLRQPEDHLKKNFLPQPFEQLIKVLREMGHNDDAKEIGYYREYYRSRRPWNLQQELNPFSWIWYALRWLFLEKALGYGYYTHRMIFLALAMWIGFALIYRQAADQGLFAPASPFVVMNKTLVDQNKQSLRESCVENGEPRWTSDGCKIGEIMPEYTKFSPWAYSTDIILPIVSFKQEADWQPIYRPMQLGFWQMPEWFLRFLVWFESIFAWVWTLSLSAVATGIIKRD